MEIKLSVLFPCFIAFTGVASQCPAGGKLDLQFFFLETILTKVRSDHFEIKYLMFSEQCVAKATCGKVLDDYERLGHAEL